MRAVVESFCRRSLARAAVLALVGWGAAGCSSDVTRFGDGNPFATRSNPAEVTGSIAPAQSAPVGQVEARPLAQPQSAQPLPPPPAPGRSAPVAGAGISGGGAGMGSFRPTSASSVVPTDTTGTVTPRSHAAARPGTAAPAWKWDGGTAVTVAPGETVATLARRYGAPASAIMQANGLTTSALRPGRQIVIPRYESNTVASSGAPASRGASAGPGNVRVPQRPAPFVHVVAPGETLVGIAKRYHKSIVEVAAANKIPPHTMVKMGDRIVIPGKIAAAAPSNVQPAPQPIQVRAPAPATGTKVASAEPLATVRMATPAAEATAVDVNSRSEAAGVVPAFRWPVRGRVITSFGAKTNGQQNDGINLAVPEGTAIRAAEDGVVAYAGNELKGYGNLILIRHASGFVTAYAHASEIMVKRNDQIRRGQVIARSGQTGTVSSPQLHFEIRKGSAPVDPMQFLPAGA